jgi:hypothetical protein
LQTLLGILQRELIHFDEQKLVLDTGPDATVRAGGKQRNSSNELAGDAKTEETASPAAETNTDEATAAADPTTANGSRDGPTTANGQTPATNQPDSDQRDSGEPPPPAPPSVQA